VLHGGLDPSSSGLVFTVLSTTPWGRGFWISKIRAILRYQDFEDWIFFIIGERWSSRETKRSPANILKIEYNCLQLKYVQWRGEVWWEIMCLNIREREWETESRVAVGTRYVKARCHEILDNIRNKRYLLICVVLVFLIFFFFCSCLSLKHGKVFVRWEVQVHPHIDLYVLGLLDLHLHLLVTSTAPDSDPDPPFSHKSVEWIEIIQIFSC
jgi:hypothetical protein